MVESLFNEIDTEILISAKEVAELAGVSAAAVANWRSRGTSGFPSPALDGPNGPLYRQSEISSWLDGRKTSTGRPLNAPLDIQSGLWAAADKLRGTVDASQYRHIVLTLLFLKKVLDPAANLSKVVIPVGQSWSTIASAKDVGDRLEEAIAKIEALNPQLQGVIPRVFGSAVIDSRRLEGLVRIISELNTSRDPMNDQLGRAYEFFLGRFAALEGRSGGEFYTPESVVRLLTEIVEPVSGSVYDPCCGSGGMFVQSAKLRLAKGKSSIQVFGQELNATTWKLAQMNLLMHSIDANLGEGPADTFHSDAHTGKQFDSILANPPFNISDWGVEELTSDRRWEFGVPPSGNANMGWVQHIWSHLKPGGRAGVVLSNGSLSSDQTQDLQIRKALIESGAIEGMVALPPQLFFSTAIPVTLWILHKPKRGAAIDQRILFVDAKDLGYKVTRTHRDLTIEETTRVHEQFERFRSGDFISIPGFAAIGTIDDVEAARWSLVPSRYVGTNREIVADSKSVEDLLGEYSKLTRQIHALDAVIASLLDLKK